MSSDSCLGFTLDKHMTPKGTDGDEYVHVAAGQCAQELSGLGFFKPYEFGYAQEGFGV